MVPQHREVLDLERQNQTGSMEQRGETAMPKRILVVDDDRDIRLTVQKCLEVEGYEVITASNGRYAVERATFEQPDLVLMDVTMPQMDGLEALRILKGDEKTASIPIVLLTAKDSYADMTAGWETGTDLYLTKPFLPSELVTFVKCILHP